MRPRCFSKAILYYGAPLHSTGSARAAFPGVISTIRALRLPVLSTELLMFFTSPLQPILSSFAPLRPERSAGPGPAQARYHWLLSAGHTQELPGSWRIHPVPLPRSRIPASSSDLTLSVQLRFKWCVTAPACKARFRPVVSPCREGVEPSGFHRKVSVRYIGLPPFPDLSWRYRKSPAHSRTHSPYSFVDQPSSYI